MYETEQIETMSKLVVKALQKKNGKDPDIRLISNKPESRAQAANLGYQQISWADLIKFGEVANMERSTGMVGIGDELTYVWRHKEFQDAVEVKLEDQNKRFETLAKDTMKAEGEKYGVDILDETTIQKR